MKKELRYGLLFIVYCLLTMTSCLKDQEDYFEESSSDRMLNTMHWVQDVLRSSEYGWALEYFPGSDLAYGGIVYTVKFDSLEAHVGCTLVPDSTYTSYYKVTNDNGPVISFDTYNPLLHYFSTPSSSEYEAKGGEFEFVVVSNNGENSMKAEEITELVLYGKKTYNTMYLRRLTESAEKYTEKTINVYDHFVERLAGKFGDTDVEGKVNLQEKSVELVCGNDTLKNSFTYTDYGIRFYRPFNLRGLSAQSFDYDIETMELRCRDEGCEGVLLQGLPFDNTRMSLKDYEGSYALRYDNNSSVRVKMRMNRLDGSLLLSGLSPMYDLRLHYDYETGDLRIAPQVIGELGGRSVYFCTYNSVGGNIWVTEKASLDIKWNGNKVYSSFNFVTTDPVNYPCDSGLIVALYNNEEGRLTASLVDEAAWMVNGSPLIANMRTLTKLRN